MSRRSDDPVAMLLVEPDPDDARRLADAFEGTPTPTAVHVVNTGEEALEFLHQRDGYADASRPDLVLLELRLPDRNGNDVLDEIKTTPEFHRIPVLSLTRSGRKEEVVRAYQSSANAHLQKPTDPDAFDDFVRAVERFWCSVAVLPPRE